MDLSKYVEDILDEKNIIGSGSYGVVVKGEIRYSQFRTPKKVALKYLEDVFSLEEINILTSIRHPNILNALGYFYSNVRKRIVHVLPLMKTDLFKEKMASKERKKLWFIQIVKAVDCLHSKNYVHFDLKEQNVLIGFDDNAYLTDFGLTQNIDLVSEMTTNSEFDKITFVYRSPEAWYAKKLRKSQVGKPADIWALGVIYGYMFYPHRTHLTSKYSHQTIESYILDARPDEDETPLTKIIQRLNPRIISVPYDFYEEVEIFIEDLINAKETVIPKFIKKCLILDPRKRITSRELLEKLNVKDERTYCTIGNNNRIKLNYEKIKNIISEFDKKKKHYNLFFKHFEKNQTDIPTYAAIIKFALEDDQFNHKKLASITSSIGFSMTDEDDYDAESKFIDISRIDYYVDLDFSRYMSEARNFKSILAPILKEMKEDQVDTVVKESYALLTRSLEPFSGAIETKESEDFFKIPEEVLEFSEVLDQTKSKSLDFKDYIAFKDTKDNIIGKGSSGNVYKGKLFYSNFRAPKTVAIKLVKYATVFELNILTSIRHPNILNSLGYTYQNEKLYQILPIMKSDISKRIKSNPSLNLKKKWFYQVTKALQCLHSKNYVHLDIKASNILIGKDNNAYLTDFGLSKKTDFLTEGEKGFLIGTAEYRSPEMWYAENLPETLTNTKASDIWSLGILYRVMFYENIEDTYPIRNLENYEKIRYNETGISTDTTNMEIDEDDTGEGLASQDNEVAIAIRKLNNKFIVFDNFTFHVESAVDKILRLGYDDYDDMEEAPDYIVRCVQYDPNERITIDELVDLIEKSENSIYLPKTYCTIGNNNKYLLSFEKINEFVRRFTKFVDVKIIDTIIEKHSENKFNKYFTIILKYLTHDDKVSIDNILQSFIFFIQEETFKCDQEIYNILSDFQFYVDFDSIEYLDKVPRVVQLLYNACKNREERVLLDTARRIYAYIESDGTSEDFFEA